MSCISWDAQVPGAQPSKSTLLETYGDAYVMQTSNCFSLQIVHHDTRVLSS